jgi:hypothetical protein
MGLVDRSGQSGRDFESELTAEHAKHAETDENMKRMPRTDIAAGFLAGRNLRRAP